MQVPRIVKVIVRKKHRDDAMRKPEDVDPETTQKFQVIPKGKESQRVPRIDTSGVIGVPRDRRRFLRRT